MKLNPFRIYRKFTEKFAQLRSLEEQVSYLQGKVSELERETRYWRNASLPESQYASALSALYCELMGKPLNLYRPMTYNEKIQWFKLYGFTPEISLLADKYRVREFVAKTVGEKYLIPLLGVWETPEQIDFSKLPDKFVLKANHGCGYNYIVKNKDDLKKSDILNKAWKWLLEDYAFTSFEMQYHMIQRRLIAEQYIENEGGDLHDYKFRCFNGKVKMIAFNSNRSQGLQMDFYDTEWNLLPIKYCSYPNSGIKTPRPDNLDEMIEVAEMLAKGFPQVRVDLYRMNDGTIYFGEMTFTPSSGFATWDPPELDKELGGLFTYSGLDYDRLIYNNEQSKN